MPEPDLTSGQNPIAKVMLNTSRDVVTARQAVAREMKARGTNTIRITRFATAVSEIARNAIMHGGGGELFVFLDRSKTYLIVRCRDRGPGIEDMDRAMTDGYTSANGLGRGLGGAKRLSHGFDVTTTVGEGTTVTMSAKL